VASNTLIDFFRRGEVPKDVRLLAAKGALAPRAHEQLALLVLLTDDPDPDVAATANATIDALPQEALRAFLARSDVSAGVRDFFAARGILPADVAAPDAAEPLVEVPPDTPEVAGGQRSQLVRDSNRMVAAAVLSSPKLTDAEVETFTKLGNVSEEVLRIIGMNRSWLKNYGVMLGLVKNPKTPPAISMQLLQRLNDRDVKMLAVDRNIPEALRMVARKLMVKSVR
jgi:hypothetical protein